MAQQRRLTLTDVITKNSNAQAQSEEKKCETTSTSHFKLFRTNTSKALDAHRGEILDYAFLDSKTAILPDAAFSDVGCVREIINFNLESETLKKYFKEFETYLKWLPIDKDAETPNINDIEDQTEAKDPTNINVLQGIITFTRTKLSIPKGMDEDQLKQLLDKKREKISEKRNVAPLEWFLELQLGYCRHQVLFTIYLLVKLIDLHAQQNDSDFEKTQSKVYRYRTNGDSFAHTLVIYETPGHRYLLDPSFNVVKDLNDLKEAEQYLQSKYPKNAPLTRILQNINETYDNLPATQDANQKTASPGF